MIRTMLAIVKWAAFGFFVAVVGVYWLRNPEKSYLQVFIDVWWVWVIMAVVIVGATLLEARNDKRRGR